jgi:hypothetical protein
MAVSICKRRNHLDHKRVGGVDNFPSRSTGLPEATYNLGSYISQQKRRLFRAKSTSARAPVYLIVRYEGND